MSYIHRLTIFYIHVCVCCNKPGFLKERSGLIIEMVKMAGGYQKGTSTVRITPPPFFKSESSRSADQ